MNERSAVRKVVSPTTYVAASEPGSEKGRAAMHESRTRGGMAFPGAPKVGLSA